MSQRLISYYEKGRDPSAMAAVLIAAASGVSVDWLLTGSEPDLDIERLAMALEVSTKGLRLRAE